MTEIRDELAAAKVRLMNAEAAAKEMEVEFAKLKIEESQRNLDLEKAQASESRILMFGADITSETVSHAIRTLDVWSRRNPGADITILLTTQGGGVFEGFRLIDFIEELKKRGHRIIIKVMGYAMSMGAVILQAASDRVITPNSWIHIHEVQISELAGNFTQITEANKHTKRIQDQMSKILAARSSLSEKQIKSRWTNAEWHMSAEEALKHGFVDRIEA